jgi:hypothetical protein
MDVTELVQRMAREFGMGSSPKLRLGFYRRVATLAAKDEFVLSTIRELAVVAKGKDKPGNWFVVAVLRRLTELGFLEGQTKGQSVVDGVVEALHNKASTLR